MTKEEYKDFVLRYKGCGACFPMYHTLSRAEKMWFTAIQKDVANLKKENAELKADNDARKFAMAMSDKVEKQLREENAELNEKLGDIQMQKAGEKSDLVWKLKTANEQKADQLTKAKEIIREFVEWATWQGNSKCPSFKNIQNKAEAFLKDSEGK